MRFTTWSITSLLELQPLVAGQPLCMAADTGEESTFAARLLDCIHTLLLVGTVESRQYRTQVRVGSEVWKVRLSPPTGLAITPSVTRLARLRSCRACRSSALRATSMLSL